jgi:NAD(P)-dependent dehydrogenase (short-subunit alcohol dehydrogenase family)
MSELEARGVRVDALVNCAGRSRFEPFEQEERRVLDLLMVNMTALTLLTRLALPGMIQRGWGRILNLSSNAALQSGPSSAEDYASKAYVLSLSIALADELRGTGVRVTAFCPGHLHSWPQRIEASKGPRPVAGGDLPDVAELAAWGTGRSSVGGRMRCRAPGGRPRAGDADPAPAPYGPDRSPRYARCLSTRFVSHEGSSDSDRAPRACRSREAPAAGRRPGP